MQVFCAVQTAFAPQSLLLMQATQVFELIKHRGVLPLQKASLVHWTQVPWAQAWLLGQSLLVTQPTQVFCAEQT